MELEEVNPVVPDRKDWCDTAMGRRVVGGLKVCLGSSSDVGFASLCGNPDSMQIHSVSKCHMGR